MTRTHSWLDRWRAELVRREAGTAVLLTAGAAMLALAFGVLLGRLGVYLTIPAAVLVIWTLVVAVIGAGIVWYRRRLRQAGLHRLAERVEHLGSLRRGSVAGVVDPSAARAGVDMACSIHPSTAVRSCSRWPTRKRPTGWRRAAVRRWPRYGFRADVRCS